MSYLLIVGRFVSKKVPKRYQPFCFLGVDEFGVFFSCVTTYVLPIQKLSNLSTELLYILTWRNLKILDQYACHANVPDGSICKFVQKFVLYQTRYLLKWYRFLWTNFCSWWFNFIIHPQIRSNLVPKKE